MAMFYLCIVGNRDVSVFQMENGISALRPRITYRVERIMSYMEERINTMQRYSGDNFFYSYISSVSGNMYDKVCTVCIYIMT